MSQVVAMLKPYMCQAMPAWQGGQRLLASARNKEKNYAEASGTCAVRLFADHQAAGLCVARWKAAGVLRGAQYRTLRVRHRHWHGSLQPHRPANDAKLRLARLRQPNRKVAPVRNPGRFEAARDDPVEQ